MGKKNKAKEKLSIFSYFLLIFLFLNTATKAENIHICTNFENINYGFYQKISNFFEINDIYFIINEKNTCEEKNCNLEVYLSIPNNSLVNQCIEQHGSIKSKVNEKINYLIKKLDENNEIYPGGPKGKKLQIGETFHFGNYKIGISVSRAPEPLRSIVAITSMLGLSNTSCYSSEKCMFQLGFF